jgi:hypothetical protein
VKKQLLMISMLAIAISVAGCTLPPPTSAPTAPVVQVTYAQACAAYGAAFAGVLQLRKANKLNQVQIDQVTLLDGQITPICTGPLPADASAATQQITAAVTSLTILETLK